MVQPIKPYPSVPPFSIEILGTMLMAELKHIITLRLLSLAVRKDDDDDHLPSNPLTSSPMFMFLDNDPHFHVPSSMHVIVIYRCHKSKDDGVLRLLYGLDRDNGGGNPPTHTGRIDITTVKYEDKAESSTSSSQPSGLIACVGRCCLGRNQEK